MIIAEQIRAKIDSFPVGYVFTLSDFALDSSKEVALAKLLSRMAASGKLRKVSKGKYYKPKETAFGIIKPAYEELVKDFLEKNGEMIGYVTGTAAFAQMGLTTQISSKLTIGTNHYRRPVKRGDYKVYFLKQDNPITAENVELLLILDAVKLIRTIPGTSPNEACKMIIGLISALSEEQISELEILSLKYTNYVRAVTGAILEYIDKPSSLVRKSLNGTSIYKLPISADALPTKLNWRIYEPA